MKMIKKGTEVDSHLCLLAYESPYLLAINDLCAYCLLAGNPCLVFGILTLTAKDKQE
jgi:hypothetical protein